MLNQRIISYLATLTTSIVLIDLIYGVVINTKEALIPSATPMARDNLPISPEFAFGWIQVTANASMLLLLFWAIWQCYYLIYHGQRYRIITFTGKHYLAFLMIIAFTFPAIWEWGWTLINLSQGKKTFSLNNTRYFLISLCQPFLLFLPYLAFINQWQARCYKKIAQTSSTP